MVYFLSCAWFACLHGLLWLVDTFCDAIADGFTWLLYNLVLRWMSGDNPGDES